MSCIVSVHEYQTFSSLMEKFWLNQHEISQYWYFFNAFLMEISRFEVAYFFNLAHAWCAPLISPAYWDVHDLYWSVFHTLGVFFCIYILSSIDMGGLMELQVFWIFIYHRGRHWKGIQILDTRFVPLSEAIF